MTTMASQRIETPDGISWYTESFHPSNEISTEAVKSYIILIPSGEGDCHNLRTVATILATKYHVLTFDTPGFSRTTAPPEAYAKVKPQLLAKQIIGLLDKLNIQRATFFGCSSGACTTLALCAFHSARVKCGIIHEAPLQAGGPLLSMLELTDDEITAACKESYGNALIEQEINDGRKKWEALGAEYHARLERNYVPWVRGYVNAVEIGGIEVAGVPENLQRRPIFWTVGSLNPGAKEGEGIWKPNFEYARAAGLQVNADRLRCMHFPSVTVPEDLAEWIDECIGKAKE